eukprot:gene27808-33623_t
MATNMRIISGFYPEKKRHLENRYMAKRQCYAFGGRVQEKIRRPPYTAHFRKGILLLHDNARPHVADIVKEKLVELKWTVLPHPPYSPDISPCDYYLFRSLEHFLRGKQFTEDNGIKNAINTFI